MNDGLVIGMMLIFVGGVICGIAIKSFIDWTIKAPSGEMDLNPVFEKESDRNKTN